MRQLVKAALNRSFVFAVRKLPARARVRLLYLKSHRRWPNLEHPSRFTELCQIIKFSSNRLAPFVDKIAVKEFVRRTIGDDHVIPTLYVGEQLPPLEERNWPLPFVIKTNHTSGGNIFVREEPDWAAIERDLDGWLSLDYSKVADEQFYASIPPRVLVEPIIGDDLVDYKIFTFGGCPEAIEVDTDRHTHHKRAFFDCSWNKLDIRFKYPMEERDVPQPSQLGRMLEIASALGCDFPFVRVDLYEVNGRVYFGELTFSPGAGQNRLEPADMETRWGKLWLEAMAARREAGSDRCGDRLGLQTGTVPQGC